MMKIYVYYHIALLNNWESIVKEQCSRLLFSGLYKRLESIRCYAIDPTGNNEEKCRRLLKKYGKKFSLEGISREGDEWFTLKHLENGIDEEDKVLYIHSKGVTRYNTTTYNINTCDFDISDLYENICDWRDLMEFYLIKNFNKCLTILDNGYDTVGINYCSTPKHYSGNFWWATGKYLRSLVYDTPSNENWILGNNSRCISLFQSPFVGYGHYFAPFSLSMVSGIPCDPIILYKV